MSSSHIRITISVCLAILLIGYAFVSNSSPYVTINEAKKTKGENLHLAGDLVDGSFENLPSKKAYAFRLKDMDGNTIPVLYTGEQPANMTNVNKIVAVGKMESDYFLAHKLLIKCPSKYESEEKQDVSIAPSVSYPLDANAAAKTGDSNGR